MMPTCQIITGDAFVELAKLPAAGVQCCVTSPPYFGLRDYGHAAQIGNETSPEGYVARIVQLGRQIRRVLRDDGTFWLNLGDCYSSGGRSSYDASEVSATSGLRNSSAGLKRFTPGWAKPKDRLLIPARVAMALGADGWYLRDEIVWNKPNPMPESVTDRTTKSHEFIYLLTKNQAYFYDAEAIQEKGAIAVGTLAAKGSAGRFNTNGVNSRPPEYKLYDGYRNKRSVWTVTTASCPDAHFATFPPDLIKPCILAGTSARGCCAKCGAPWERIISERKLEIEDSELDRYGTGKAGVHRKIGSAYQKQMNANPIKTLGWKPTCGCHAEVAEGERYPACTVLDPCAGRGTTGEVALELGRNVILIELNPKYAAMCVANTNNTTPGLPFLD
jgi:DNA modification methylase